MSDWLMRVIKAEADRLVELAAEDDELRADLRALAESILAATATPESKIDHDAPHESLPRRCDCGGEPNRGAAEGTHSGEAL